jgi:glycosyltransferase involved in cell wall biosynthesis
VILDARVVTGAGGGPDKTIVNSPRFLELLGYRMLCAYMHPPDDPGFATLRQKAERSGAPLISIPDRGAWDWRVFTAALAVCKRERVTVWHGHDYKSNALGLLLKRFWPMRLVTTVHGWVRHTNRTPLYYRIDQFCLPRYERVICVSDDLLEACLSAGVPTRNCVLLENGIDASEYTRQRTIAEAKAALGLPAAGLVVGAVGRLSSEKGFETLIRSIKVLRARGLNVSLVLVGDGAERTNLERLIYELNLASWVHLAGWQSEVRPYLEAMDVFALSSLREGLPNVLLEAMAVGIPVAATRVNGVPRLIQDRQNGLLVTAGDRDGLTDALGQLLTSVPMRETLARAGQRTVETRYSFATRMRRLKCLYDDLLQRSPGVLEVEQPRS